MKITLDASVYIAALQDDIMAHGARDFLRTVILSGAEIYVPRYFALEVIAALYKLTQIHSLFQKLSAQFSQLENCRWVDMDFSFTKAACESAETGLKGADCIYAAAAVASGSWLVTLDDGMRRRVGAVVKVVSPDQYLLELEKAS